MKNSVTLEEQVYAPLHRELTKKNCYRPPVLRLPSLMGFTAVILLLIGLLELASKRLPLTTKNREGPFSNLTRLHSREDTTYVVLTARQNNVSITPSRATTVVTTRITTEETSFVLFTPTPTTAVTAVRPSTTGTFAGTGGTTMTTGQITAFRSTGGGYIPTEKTTNAPPSQTPSTTLDTSVSTDADGAVSTVIRTRTVSPSPSADITYIFTTDSSLTTITSIGALGPTTITSALPKPSDFSARANKAVLQWKDARRAVFTASYLPIILAAILQVYWTAIYASVKVIEPFIQLSKPSGALGKDTLFAYYLSSNLTWAAMGRFLNGHWLILWTSITYCTVIALGPLSSELFFLDSTYDCPNPDLNDKLHPCWPPRVSANPTVLRATQGLLAFIAIMTVNVAVMVWRSQTGVYNNPSSIAEVAKLMNQPDFLDDFRNADTEASIEDLQKQLGNRRYRLQDYLSSDGRWKYVIMPLPGAGGNSEKAYEPVAGRSGVLNQRESQQPLHQAMSPISPISPTFNLSDPGTSFPTIESDTETESRTHTRLWDILADGAFALLLLGVLGVVIAYFMDASDSGFNRFFNSNSFGPRFLFAAVGAGVASNWKRLERYTHTLTTISALSASRSPHPSILTQSRPTTPLTAVLPMLFSHQYVASLVALTALLSECLIVTLAGVPFNPGQIHTELLVCSYLSMALLGLMILVLIVLIAWRWRLPHLPRRPETIAAVVSYLCASAVVDGLDGGHGTNSTNMRRRSRRRSITAGRSLTLTRESWEGGEFWREERSSGGGLGIFGRSSQDDRDGVLGGRRVGYGWMIGVDARRRWAVDYVD